ncbi:glycosyltransferase family 4 protein [Methanocella conradii]|uniref:glycosyltransferase family 4 protein n=1 Tax=Methanocella conradii TaxID=1175444 RepID=UPI0024B33B85|nr:glycosyltransferase family 4 protein [Methanocella conradii]MDI6897322.1 glycosyltransferase family 4 protein [Methanocella conradii]
MRIGVVHWAFPPVVGGVESHLIYLYGEMARMGHEVSFLTAPHPMRRDEDVGWCRVISNELMSIGHLLKKPPGRDEVEGMIEGFIEKEAPEIVHAHNLHYFFPHHAEALGRLCRKYCIPVVLTVHNYWGDDLCRRLLRDVGWDMVVAVSYHLKKYCIFDAGLPPEKVEVHYHGIDLERYRALEDREALKARLGLSGRRVIFHPARMCEMKGTLHSIEAIAMLKEKYRDVCLVLSGNGDTVDFENERPAFKACVKKLVEGLKVSDSIHFVSIPAEEMPLYMNAADVVIYPTVLPQGEAFGIAPVEAMACGRPVIVTDSGGLAESTRHGVNGLVLDCDTSSLTAELARSIEYLLEHPEACHYLGENGREVAEERFDSRKMALRMEGLYGRLALARLACRGDAEAPHEAKKQGYNRAEVLFMQGIYKKAQ